MKKRNQSDVPQEVLELMVKASYGDRASKEKLAKILIKRAEERA